MDTEEDNAIEKPSSPDQRKGCIEFFKLFTTLASGSILLVMNVLTKKEIVESGWVKLSMISSLVCFTACVWLGIVTIRDMVRMLDDDSFNFQSRTLWMECIFICGYILLLVSIIIAFYTSGLIALVMNVLANWVKLSMISSLVCFTVYAGFGIRDMVKNFQKDLFDFQNHTFWMGCFFVIGYIALFVSTISVFWGF